MKITSAVLPSLPSPSFVTSTEEETLSAEITSTAAQGDVAVI